MLKLERDTLRTMYERSGKLVYVLEGLRLVRQRLIYIYIPRCYDDLL